jgi:hypothetical protein
MGMNKQQKETFDHNAQFLHKVGLIEPIMNNGKEAIQITEFGLQISKFLNMAREYPTDILKEILKEFEETKQISETENFLIYDNPELHKTYYEAKLITLRFVLDLFKVDVEAIENEKKLEEDF